MQHKKIRRGVFETNSSSTHSICIFTPKTLAVLDRLPVDHDGICRIFGGEFGWEFETHYSPITKASYCLTYAKTVTDATYLPKNMKAEEVSQNLCDMLKNVIEDHMKVPVEFCPIENDYYTWGYIDHQSHIGESNACREAFADKQSLRNFIFNPESFLVTDNDNRELDY